MIDSSLAILSVGTAALIMLFAIFGQLIRIRRVLDMEFKMKYGKSPEERGP